MSARTRQLGLLLLVMLLAGPGVSAQDVLSSEPSSIAQQNLLLDITRVGKDVITVGMRGHVLRSADCGKSWQQIIVPTRETLTAVYFLDDKHGWIVGHGMTIMKTEDGGRQWQLVYQDIAAEQPLFDVLFISKTNGFAIGAYGAFLTTTDGGQSWKSGTIYGGEDFHLYAISRTRAGELLVSGEAGAVYLSINSGSSWEIIRTPYAGTYFGNLPIDRDRILIYGMRGHVFSSGDLGYSWENINTGSSFSLSAGVALHDGTILLSGDGGVLLQSRDGGEHFESLPPKNRHHKSAMVECMDGGVLAVGEAGVERVR